MAKKTHKRWLLPLIIIVILALVVMGAVLLGGRYAHSIADSRPLVIIHSPANRNLLETGEFTSLHATARSDQGIARMEFWVDDTLIEIKDAADPAGTQMTLVTNWQPDTPGSHALLVRAVSGNKVNGQSSIAVEVAEAPALTEVTYTVTEGEDLVTIAEAFETTPDELAGLNPDMGDELSPGDELILPEGSETVGEPPSDSPAPPPMSDEEAPEPEADPPGSLLEVAGYYDLNLLFQLLGLRSSDPVNLQIEILELQTSSEFEGLHCYIGLAGVAPRWYPDVDGDQSTDESFTGLGEGAWDVATYLAGDGAVHFTWPGNETLAIDSSCVGISGGGTIASEIGHVLVNAAPGDWDGASRQVASSGGESSYTMTYRISVSDRRPGGFPIWLDPNMTPPSNLRLDDRRSSLRWDYEPRPDEEPIDGFRLYLNDNLQWVEPADARETGLPYEWLTPPCGTTYRLTVTAFREGFPDGPESPPALPEVLISTPTEDCHRQIQITFDTLETFDLPGDGRYEDRSGDVGPAYGDFFVNDHTIHFDGRSYDDSWGSLDLPMGLYDNTTYDLFEMYRDSSWEWSNPPSTIVEVEPGGTFQFSLSIDDEDTGRCRRSGDPGCDDDICDIQSALYQDSAYSDIFDIHHEESLTSEDGRCRLTYHWGPAPGSPVGSGYEGDEPLPWINVETLEVMEESGAVRIHVRNTGTGTWPRRDLEVELRTRDGESLGITTFEDFVLEPGQREILSGGDMVVGPPYDVCIVIDPNDLMLEAPERNGTLVHQPICMDLPNLTITDVRYQADGAGHVKVTVQNIGEHALIERQVGLTTILADGSPAYLMGSWPVGYLGPNQARVFDLVGVNETMRERLRGGYTVTVNPDNLLAETSLDDNDYEVRGATEMTMFWCDRYIPHIAGLTSAVRMNMSVDIIRGSQSERVAESSWSHDLSGQEVIWGYNHREWGGPAQSYACEEDLGVFEIVGDEQLAVNFNATYRVGNVGSFENIGSRSFLFTQSDGFGAGLAEPGMTSPIFQCDETGGIHSFWVDFILGLTDGSWHTRYAICERQ